MVPAAGTLAHPLRNACLVVWICSQIFSFFIPKVLVTCGLVFHLFVFGFVFYFPVAVIIFLLPVIHVSSHYAQMNFTYQLLNLICGECTEFKHINKYFNFHRDLRFIDLWGSVGECHPTLGQWIPGL